jgi:hypothetical protein
VGGDKQTAAELAQIKGQMVAVAGLDREEMQYSIPRQAGAKLMLLGLDNTAWTAIGAIAGLIYCGLTAGLLGFAIFQIQSAKAAAKITRTLAASDRYDMDPVLDRVTNITGGESKRFQRRSQKHL